MGTAEWVWRLSIRVQMLLSRKRKSGDDRQSASPTWNDDGVDGIESVGVAATATGDELQFGRFVGENEGTKIRAKGGSDARQDFEDHLLLNHLVYPSSCAQTPTANVDVVENGRLVLDEEIAHVTRSSAIDNNVVIGNWSVEGWRDLAMKRGRMGDKDDKQEIHIAGDQRRHRALGGHNPIHAEGNHVLIASNRLCYVFQNISNACRRVRHLHEALVGEEGEDLQLQGNEIHHYHFCHCRCLHFLCRREGGGIRCW